MGMFDRDKTLGGLRLDQEFTIGNKDARGSDGGEVFILCDCHVLPNPIELDNDIKEPAYKSVLRVCRWDPDSLRVTGPVFDVGTLSSAIASKVREKADDDLPALVRAHTAPAKSSAHNDATVLTFVSPYDGPNIPFNLFTEDEYNPVPPTSPDHKPAAKAKA